MRNPPRILLLLVGVLAGVFVALVMSLEWRAKLSQPLAQGIDRMIEKLPYG